MAKGILDDQKTNSAYFFPGRLLTEILDDDGDMLLWQKDDFFQTSFTGGGLTGEVAERVIAHLNG